MIFNKKNKNRSRPGATRISAQQDIARLLNHDWSDPQLDHYFTRIVERLTRKTHTVPRDEAGKEKEAPTSLKR